MQKRPKMSLPAKECQKGILEPLLNIPVLRLISVSRNIKVDRRFDLRVAFTHLHNVFEANQQQSLIMDDKSFE
eukprot:scaffold39974_cov20-Prasinocladus_malaysianus.AAC.1